MNEIMVDDKIFEELMTSNFHDELKDSEWRNLLFKFRSFYKILYSKYKREKDDREIDEKLNKEKLSELQKIISRLQLENSELEQSKLKLEQPRKLTLRERFTGWVNNDI
jgi:hypothetical protein